MAETSGLLNRRTGFTRTEGSNPSVSARIAGRSLAFDHLVAMTVPRPIIAPAAVSGASVVCLKSRIPELDRQGEMEPRFECSIPPLSP